MKVFISQPMNGKTKEEITAERNRVKDVFYTRFGTKKITFIDSYFGDEYKGDALKCLGKSIEKLSEADLAVFVGNWEKSRGCKIEFECAVEYGIEVRVLNIGRDINFEKELLK